MSEIVSTTPPASKEAIAKALGRDRRTITRIIEEAGIPPAGRSPAGLRLYDPEAVQEALEEKEAASLPPMTQEESANSLAETLSFGWLALDYLAENLPPEILRDAFNAAMQRRTEGLEPQCLWLRYAGDAPA